MITAKSLKQLIRYKLGDNNEVQYSDYDILQAINEVLRYVNQYYINSDFLEKVQHYRQDDMNTEIDEYNASLSTDPSDETAEKPTPKEHIDMPITGVDLPDYFLTLVRIVDGHGRDLHPGDAIRPPRWDEYKIFHNKLYAGVKDVDMLYNAAFLSITDLDTGKIDLPAVFLDSLCKLACMVLTQTPDGDTMQQAVEAALANVVPMRKYANTEKRMPFIC